MRILWILIPLTLLLAPADLEAGTDPKERDHLDMQSVVRVGRGTPELDRLLDEFLVEDSYQLVSGRFTISASDTIDTNILVLDATLIVEGLVEGMIVGVESNIFLRPGAEIRGDLVNLAGGLYRSSLAPVMGRTIDQPLAPYRVYLEPDKGWLIEGYAQRKRLELDGFLGFHVPTYERVNALGIRWGARYILEEGRALRPTELHGWIGYMSGRGAAAGGGEARWLYGRGRITLGAADQTRTHDYWVRSDLRNSISFLWDGDDYRNYYRTRWGYLAAQYEIGDQSRQLTIGSRASFERDRSLRTVHTWTIVGGKESRPNPPIGEGDIRALTTSIDGNWIGRRLAWEGVGIIETASTTIEGIRSFTRATLIGEFGMDAFANHALLTRWYFQAPILGTRRLPRQRWNTLGGSGTLSAYPIGEFYGDRVALVENRYVIPLPERWSLPIAGRPDFEIAHAIGNAWTRGESSDLAQSLEVRLRFTFFYLRAAIDPSDTKENRIGVGLNSPFSSRFPWRTH